MSVACDPIAHMATSERPAVRLGAIALDTADPTELAAFWRELLGLEVIWRSDDFVALSGAPVLITVQRVADHRPPQWPNGDIPKQIHLEVAVDDLNETERLALALGASRADEQPQPDRWRVLLDPAGHPFCLSTQIPDP